MSGDAGPTEPSGLVQLRSRVRSFLAECIAAGVHVPQCDAWMGGFNREFSRLAAEQGWVGMTVPVELGGRGRSSVERYVVIEEFLAGGAPVAAHWIADRQISPALVKHGTDRQRQQLLPAICRGEITFCLGLSEPDSGSDLTSIRTSARAAGDTLVVNGTKVWTTGAANAQYMLALIRTSREADRHAGLTQVIVDLSRPGISIRPIPSMDGQAHFNEVSFADVVVDRADVLGVVGAGWAQILSELTDERSGPERFLSTMPLLRLAATTLAADRLPPDGTLGRLAARAWAIRSMSRGVAAGMDSAADVSMTAAMVKVLGAQYERDVIDGVRVALEAQPSSSRLEHDDVTVMLNQALTRSPAFSLRGGTSEILRGLISRRVA